MNVHAQRLAALAEIQAKEIQETEHIVKKLTQANLSRYITGKDFIIPPEYIKLSKRVTDALRASHDITVIGTDFEIRPEFAALQKCDKPHKKM